MLVDRRKSLPRWVSLLPLAFLCLSTLLYWPALNGPFLFDDEVMVNDDVSSGLVHSIATLQWHHPESRPLVRLTLQFEAAVFGNHPWVRRGGNILIHTCAALALFFLVAELQLRRLCQAAPTHNSDNHYIVALLIATVWLVHPLQSAAVAYIVQRGESLMGLFFLLYLYCVARLCNTRLQRWQFLATGCFVLGLWSKTVMVTAPVVGLLMDRAFFGNSWRSVFSRQKLLLMMPATGSVGAAWLLLPGILRGDANVGFGGDAPPMILYLAAQAKVIWLYVLQAIWPQWLSVDHGLRPPSFWYETWPWMLMTLALLVWVIRLSVRGRWEKVFFIVSPLCVLSLTSSFVPTADLWVDHRMYVPMASMSAGLVLLLRNVIRMRTPSASGEWKLVTIVCIVLIPLAVRTWLRADDFGDGVRVWAAAVMENPDNDRAIQNLINAARNEGRESELLDILRRGQASAKNRHIVPAVIQGRIGERLIQEGKPQEAISALQEAIELDEKHFTHGFRENRRHRERASMHVNLGLAYASIGMLEEATSELNSSFRHNDGMPDARALAGSISLQTGDTISAIHHFERALELRPGWADVEANLNNLRTSATAVSKHPDTEPP